MSLATVKEVESKLRELIVRLRSGDLGVKRSLRDSLPDPRVLALSVPDLSATYWAELIDGHLGDLHEGEPEVAHLRIRAESDDLIRLVDGELHLVSAYLTGRISVEASVADMLTLRKMMP